MEIIDNRGKNSKIVGSAYLEPTLTPGGIFSKDNPTHQGDHILDMTAQDPTLPVIDNLEDAHGHNNPSLSNLKQRKYTDR
jgi:hypothetical protein